MITVAIIDDHDVVRMGLRYLLRTQPDMRLVGEGDSAVAARTIVAEKRPQVLLLDIRMPGMDGLGALDTLLAEFPDLKVVMLTMSDLEDDIYRAVMHGAKGYVLKDRTSHLMLDAIRTVAAGGDYFPDEVMRRFHEHDPKTDLTPRERIVMDYMGKGLTNTDIARLMNISVNGVKGHLMRIFEKLGAKDRAEATAIAIRRGLI